MKSAGDGATEKAREVLANADDHVAKDMPELALELLRESLEMYRGEGDLISQAAVLHKMVGVNIGKGNGADAAEAASEFLTLFRGAKDVMGEAAAVLLSAEVRISNGLLDEASTLARQALRLFKQQGQREGQVSALSLVATAELTKESELAVQAGEEMAKILHDMEDTMREAAAHLVVANAHLAKLSAGLRRCSLPSRKSSLDAARSAKYAYELFGQARDHEGQLRASSVVSKVLQVNGLSPNMYDTADNLYNVLVDGVAQPREPETERRGEIQKGDSKKGSKLFDRTKFSWRETGSDYSYTLIWEPRKAYGPQTKHCKLNYSFGRQSACVPFQVGLKTYTPEESPGSDLSQSMMVYVNAYPESSDAYGSAIMSSVLTLASMMAAGVKFMTFVQIGETVPHNNDLEVGALHQQFRSAVSLAIIRSARLERPDLTVGYVACDMETWMGDRAPIFAAISDTVESDESETFFKRSEPYGPTLVHNKMPDPISFVKPDRK